MEQNTKHFYGRIETAGSDMPCNASELGPLDVQRTRVFSPATCRESAPAPSGLTHSPSLRYMGVPIYWTPFLSDNLMQHVLTRYGTRSSLIWDTNSWWLTSQISKAGYWRGSLASNGSLTPTLPATEAKGPICTAYCMPGSSEDQQATLQIINGNRQKLRSWPVVLGAVSELLSQCPPTTVLTLTLYLP